MEHDVRNWETRNSRWLTGRCETRRAEYFTDMWDTESMRIRRAERMQRNIGMDEGWHIYRGYSVELLECKSGNFKVNVSWDWEPVEVNWAALQMLFTCWSNVKLVSRWTPKFLMVLTGLWELPVIDIDSTWFSSFTWCLLPWNITSDLVGFRHNPFCVNQFWTACVHLSRVSKEIIVDCGAIFR